MEGLSLFLWGFLWYGFHPGLCIKKVFKLGWGPEDGYKNN